jgi:hypothetical protein
MNADYRNGVNHTVAGHLPEPSANGSNGGLHQCPEAPSANGSNSGLHQCPEAPSANGDIGTGESGPSPSANGANGRDQRGRFAKGNSGGPGNPFARRTAMLRRVLSTAVTEKDIAAIAKRLLEQAKAGDVAAARLLLSYAIGQPTEAVDPDTLDQQEWAIFRQVPVPAPEVERLIHDVPVDFACEMARALAPHLGDIAAKKAKPIFAGTHESGKKRTRRGKRRKAPARAGGARGPAADFSLRALHVNNSLRQTPVDSHSRFGL